MDTNWVGGRKVLQMLSVFDRLWPRGLRRLLSISNKQSGREGAGWE